VYSLYTSMTSATPSRWTCHHSTGLNDSNTPKQMQNSHTNTIIFRRKRDIPGRTKDRSRCYFNRWRGPWVVPAFTLVGINVNRLDFQMPTTHGPGYGVSLLTPKFLLYLNTSGSKYGTSGETGNCLEQGSMFTVRSAQLW